jgi:HEAT repeat protein
MMTSAIFTLMLVAQVVSGGIIRQGNPVPADVAARHQAIRSAPTSLDKANSDLLPLIEKSLQDTDTQVRLSAIGTLTQLNMNIQNAARNRQAVPKQIDSRGRSSLESVLMRVLNDSDFRVRGGAVTALGFVSKPPGPTVRMALIAAFQRERESSVRAAIIGQFGIFNNPESADVQETLVDAISDVSPDVRRVAAMGVAKFHPAAALQKIVAELQTGTSETRSEFVHALASYQALAKPYISVLEKALESETRESYKEQIRRTIIEIQDSRE